MEPRVVKILHDGLQEALDDPENLKVLDQLDQEPVVPVERGLREYAREDGCKGAGADRAAGAAGEIAEGGGCHVQENTAAYNGSREGKVGAARPAPRSRRSRIRNAPPPVAGMPSSMFLTEGFLPEELLEEERNAPRKS